MFLHFVPLCSAVLLAQTLDLETFWPQKRTAACEAQPAACHRFHTALWNRLPLSPPSPLWVPSSLKLLTFCLHCSPSLPLSSIPYTYQRHPSRPYALALGACLIWYEPSSTALQQPLHSVTPEQHILPRPLRPYLLFAVNTREHLSASAHHHDAHRCGSTVFDIINVATSRKRRHCLDEHPFDIHRGGIANSLLASHLITTRSRNPVAANNPF